MVCDEKKFRLGTLFLLLGKIWEVETKNKLIFAASTRNTSFLFCEVNSKEEHQTRSNRHVDSLTTNQGNNAFQHYRREKYNVSKNQILQSGLQRGVVDFTMSVSFIGLLCDEGVPTFEEWTGADTLALRRKSRTTAVRASRWRATCLDPAARQRMDGTWPPPSTVGDWG